MKTELNNSTQTNKPSNPTPTLTLPLKGREIAMLLPLQGGGQEGDGVFVGVVLNLPYRKINGTHKISAGRDFAQAGARGEGVFFSPIP
jgi:hypothetical protein